MNIIKYNYSTIFNNIEEQSFFYAKIFLIIIFQACILFTTLLNGMKYSISKSLLYHIVFFVLLFFVIEAIPLLKNKIVKFLLFCFFSVLVGLLITFYIHLMIGDSSVKQTEFIKVLFVLNIVLLIYIYLFLYIVSIINKYITPSSAPILLFYFLLFIILLLIIIIYSLSILSSYTSSNYSLFIIGLVFFILSVYIAYYTIKIAQVYENNENPIYTSTDYVIYFTKKLNYYVFYSLYRFFSFIYEKFFSPMAFKIKFV